MEFFFSLSLSLSFPLSHHFNYSQLLDPPEIVERPKDVAVRSGGIAAFYCRARGEPTPQLSWRKNGRKVTDKEQKKKKKLSPAEPTAKSF